MNFGILSFLPDDIKRLIISFMIRPPHYLAYITGLRPVLDNELYTFIIPPPIKLISNLDQEWYAFNQEYLENEEDNFDGWESQSDYEEDDGYYSAPNI